MNRKFTVPNEKIIAKYEFIDLYQEIYSTVELLSAPFGVITTSDLIFSTFSVDNELHQKLDHDRKDHYTKIFSQWEELLVRKVMAEKGYTQDQMSASISRYLSGSVLDAEDRKPDMMVSSR